MNLPPQNIIAEESILSGCLLYPDLAKEAATLLIPDAFYKTLNQKIFRSILKSIEKGITPDITSVYSDLKNIEGISIELNKITDEPIPIDLKNTAKIINDCYTARLALIICQNTSAAIFDNIHSVEEIINTLQNQTLELGAESKESFITMCELTNQSIDRYELLKDQKATAGLKTGYYDLDSLTGGFRGSKLIIIAARPAIGKTAFMCNMIENMGKLRIKSGVFELEMDKEDLDDRWFASMSGINSIRLSTPPLKKEHELNQKEWELLTEAASKKSEWPVILDDTGSLSVAEIKRRSRKMKQMGVEIIFIDQLSEIKGNSRKSLFESNTEIVEELGRLKKELRIPIVLLAQLNRQVENREDKEPRLSDLKNTGMLEEKADIVLLGYRKHVYTQAAEDETHAQWHIAKHRGGPTRKIEMIWHSKQARFENLAK